MLRWTQGESAVVSRRSLLVGVGASVLLAAHKTFAQSSTKSARIGFLRFSDQQSGRPYVESFREGLRNLGYAEGRDFVLETRFADGRAERLVPLAEELIRRKVALIVTTDTPATRAAQQVTAVIPLVMVNVIDPVGSGFVDSLARPGGNITGLTSMTGDISAKHIQLLRTVVPKLSRIAIFVNPSNPAHRSVLLNVESSSRQSGIATLAVWAQDRQQIEQGFAAIVGAKAQAMIVVADAFFAQQRQQMAALAARHQLASISANREYVEAGALMSYGQNFQDNARRAAIFVDKILKGAKPEALAIERPTKFDLVINRGTAKTLGLTLPHELTLVADAIID
jgi:putative tryptophan/tyrosine transport system substrate-binding protein